MRPAGCARVCGRCDKPVHDLSHYTLEETEALLRRNPEACVRAQIDRDGVVALKTSRRDNARRMMIAAAATAGMLAASPPAIARPNRPDGGIAGNIEFSGFRTRVTATGADGQTYRTRAGYRGRFRLRHLPAGTYTLTFVPDCGSSWTVENVVVGAQETVVPNVRNEDACIMVGLLRIEDAAEAPASTI